MLVGPKVSFTASNSPAVTPHPDLPPPLLRAAGGALRLTGFTSARPVRVPVPDHVDAFRRTASNLGVSIPVKSVPNARKLLVLVPERTDRGRASAASQRATLTADVRDGGAAVSRDNSVASFKTVFTL